MYYDYSISKVCVVTNDETLFYPASSLKRYINILYLKHDSSLEGRKDSFRHLMPSKKYIPIYVHSKLCLIPFPDGSWVNYFNIERVKKHNNEFEIFFKNKTIIKINYVSRMSTTLLHASQFLKMIDA